MNRSCKTCKHADHCAMGCSRWQPMAKKDKGKDALLNLDEARRIWPGKKRGLQTEFANFCRQHKDWEELLEDKGIAMCVSVMRANQLYREGFWPMFATFVNQRRWEEVT